MFEKVDTICLIVSNLELSSEWYQDIGFKISFQGTNDQVLTVGTSEVSLTIEEGKVEPKKSRTYPIFCK